MDVPIGVCLIWIWLSNLWDELRAVRNITMLALERQHCNVVGLGGYADMGEKVGSDFLDELPGGAHGFRQQGV
jgi:hypothetical protein